MSVNRYYLPSTNLKLFLAKQHAKISHINRAWSASTKRRMKMPKMKMPYMEQIL